MLFLLPIPVSLVLAVLWAWWVGRPKPPADPAESVEEWARALQALGASARPERLVRSR